MFFNEIDDRKSFLLRSGNDLVAILSETYGSEFYVTNRKTTYLFRLCLKSKNSLLKVAFYAIILLCISISKRSKIMITSTYSSGIVSEACWFIEFKEYLKMLRNGASEDEIKKEFTDNNFTGAPNEYRAQRNYGYLKKRVSSMDEKAIELFFNLDLKNQKLMNFICIMRSSRILFEFVNEKYREKIILGAEYLEPSDINIFFKDKELQCDDVAEWKDATKKRLKGCFITMLTESNLLMERDKKRVITPPVIDILLEKYLEGNGESDIIKALTGVY